jgi:GAF domain-containing protein
MSGPTTGRELLLGQTFVRLADSLVHGFDVVELLDGLVTSCVDLLDATAVGLMLTDQRGQLRVMATSSERSLTLELFELQNDEGPCLDCFRSGAPVSVLDPAEQEARWPLFAAELRARGFGPSYALPMRLRDDVIGALNLFGAPGLMLAESDLQIAQALADVATIAIMQHRTIRAGEQLAEQLQTALNSRIAIEQAKGVISEHAHVEMDVAFDLLRGYARRSQLRLSDVAAAIAARRIEPGTVTQRGSGTPPGSATQPGSATPAE